ncbi:helix-turn-helix domain-containing protein [Phyllobacterium sp. P5_D12]
MLFVPLPFVVAFLLLILLVQMIRRNDNNAPNLFFTALIAVYVLQSVVIGVRWGYGVTKILPVQALLAAIVPALAWLSFEGLRDGQSPLKRPMLLLHALPALLILGFIAFWPAPISLALILIFLGYGIALTALAWAGPNALGSSRLDGVISAYRALQVTAFAVLASGLTDIVISFDFAETGGVYSGSIVAFGNVLALLILGTAATVAGTSQPPTEAAGDEGFAPVITPSVEDTEVAASLDDLMQSRFLYRDVDLNLNRLARKMGLPVRQVSSAVNRVKSMSVSQYVNDYRVREACRSLADTDEPITRIMFDAGFQTKSNFNREFLRVTGMSPKAWRARASVANEKTEKIIRLVG